jgi:4-oxalocrotonate tautomerase
MERSFIMPLIQVNIMEGRPPEKIKALIENITDTVVETLDAPKQSVRVLVTEMPKTHWGIAGVPASERK